MTKYIDKNWCNLKHKKANAHREMVCIRIRFAEFRHKKPAFHDVTEQSLLWNGKTAVDESNIQRSCISAGGEKPFVP